jgi:hypothetical protein
MTEELQEWLETIDVVLDRLRDFFLPKDFPFDYSPASLERLEELVLDEYPEVPPQPGGSGGAFVESVMAYLGEALMRTAGGHWAFRPHPANPSVKVPFVRLDEALGHDPISPLQLIIDALGKGTGTVFADTQAVLERAVVNRKAADPSWSPTKQRTHADDPAPEPPANFLAGWLSERERSFPRWLHDYAGDPTAFDFSPGSLGALGEVARRAIPSGEAFDNPKNREFVEGATWYLGEVIRRATDAKWRYLDMDPAINPLAGRPYLISPDHTIGIPRGSLRGAVDDPTALDRLLNQFT